MNISELTKKIQRRVPHLQRKNKYISEFLFVYFTIYNEFVFVPLHLVDCSAYLSKIYHNQDEPFIKTIFKSDNTTVIVIETQHNWIGLKNLNFFEMFIFCEDYLLYPYIQIYSDFLEKINPDKVDKIRELLDFLGIERTHIFYRYIDLMQQKNYILDKIDVQFIRN